MHIIILGAGISGLSLAWFLRKRHGDEAQITILEKSNRVGGYLQTMDRQGFLFEQGPRGCRPDGTGIETLKLIEELNLQDQVIVNHPDAKRRFLYLDQKLRSLPKGFGELVTTPWLCKLLVKPLLKEWFVSRRKCSDESIYQFFSRRFSPEIALTLIDPLISGIYAGDIHQLSLKSCFPSLDHLEQQHGSILKGLFSKKKNPEISPFIREIQQSSLFTLKNGMETLALELARQMKGVKILLNTPVNSLKFDSDKVYSTLSAQELAPLMQDSGMKEMIGSIRSTSLAVVNIGYHSRPLPHSGFGYLIPSKEKEKILGMVWDSSIFPQQNRSPEESRVTVMIGGEHFPNLDQYSDEQIEAIALESVKKHLNVSEVPDLINTMRKISAIPQYLVGHEKKVQAIKHQMHSCHPNLILLGTSFGGVSVNDCIANAKKISLV